MSKRGASGKGQSSSSSSKGNDKKLSKTTGSGHLLDTKVGCSDMVLLDPLTVQSMVKNLHERYKAGEIYTYIGHVVISINPYRPLDIYSPRYVTEYRSRNIFELPPHVYAIADDAYRSLRDRNKDQCIIISGESGAGKTEASKLIMQYVAQVSGKGDGVDRVKEQLLQSNPVLEAFGNAKTLKNDNSSRFGKYMDIEFNFKGDPIGGVISTYLLEKSRVIHQTPGEQNFHIFFQLLSGTDDDFLEMLHLSKDFKKYNYLTDVKTSSSFFTNQTKGFETTVKAMEVIGFTAGEISGVFELLAAILNLGNITFKGFALPNGTNACELQNIEAARYACDMLGCSVELLTQCLTQKSVETSRETVLTPLSASDSFYARDGLSKAIYVRLFHWIVSRINEKIKPKSSSKKKTIGVLDIYGFEVFESNSFEQFMINFCNEKLQQLFVDLTIGSEQQEYILEGIEWETVEFFDNSAVCEMIEDPKTGILALLDEECLRPGQVSDLTFLAKLNQRYSSDKRYVSRASRNHRSDSTIEMTQFKLEHYAGMVSYDVTGFVDKNRDLLFKDLSQAMFACERRLLKTMFPEGDLESAHLKRPTTTGYQFKASISEMMKNLLSKNPNYVRCIKPNDEKQSKVFEDKLVEAQIRYMNLLENIRVRRAGYAFRQSYEQALLRYKMLSPKTWPTWKKSPRDGIKVILKDCNRKPEEYSFGRTKLFIRNPRTVFMLEEQRKKKMHDLAITISKNYRGWSQRKKFLRIRNSQLVISKHFRGSKIREDYLRKRNATIVIQSYFRGWQVRDTLAQVKRITRLTLASYTIKRYYYAWKLKKTINDRIYAKKCLPAAVVIQKHYRGWKVRRSLRPPVTAYDDDNHSDTSEDYENEEDTNNDSSSDNDSTVPANNIQFDIPHKVHPTISKNTAASIVTKFIHRALAYRFLVTLFHNLPSRSPLVKKWPRCSPLFKKTSVILRNIFHKWRCKLVRDYYNSNLREKYRLSEKSRASSIFKGNKSLYPSSVPVGFISDRLRIRTDEKWLKLIQGAKSETRIVWADHVQKMNRTDAKLSRRELVITATSLYILDTKYNLQYILPLTDVACVSLSPHNDQFFIVHLKKKKESSGAENRAHPKGDFVMLSKHTIEGITKLSAIIQELTRKQLPIRFVTNIDAQLKQGESSLISFHNTSSAAAAATYSPACHRKGNTININVD